MAWLCCTNRLHLLEQAGDSNLESKLLTGSKQREDSWRTYNLLITDHAYMYALALSHVCAPVHVVIVHNHCNIITEFFI